MTTKPLLRDEITMKLRKLVIQHQGDKLVRIEAERDLARRFRVSRISLRAAIKNLADEGLVARKRGSGTYVLPKQLLSTIHVLLAPDIKPQDPFYIGFMSELSHRLASSATHLKMLGADHKFDGCYDAPLVIVGKLERTLLLRLKGHYSHIITTFNYSSSEGLNQICYDDYEIGREAAMLLHGRGVSRLVHLAGPDHYSSSLQRKFGFLHACEEIGVKPAIIEGKMNWSSGYQLGETVARLCKRSNGRTGIFAANDWMAIGLVQRLAELGVTVPNDLSIIGCDNIPLSREISPQLATFDLDMELLVTDLFSTLHSLIQSQSTTQKRVLLRAKFVDRESLAHVETAAAVR